MFVPGAAPRFVRTRGGIRSVHSEGGGGDRDVTASGQSSLTPGLDLVLDLVLDLALSEGGGGDVSADSVLFNAVLVQFYEINGWFGTMPQEENKVGSVF